MPALVEKLFSKLIPEGCRGSVLGVEHSKALKLFKKTFPGIVMGFVTLNLCDPLLLILLPFSQVCDAQAHPCSGSTSCTAIFFFLPCPMLPDHGNVSSQGNGVSSAIVSVGCSSSSLGTQGCSQLAGLPLLSPGETA